MTSLAHQLKRLALPQNDPNLFTRKEVASLLFDPKYAATMDRTTFYALGCNGLEELLGIEPAFAEFQDTLFNQGSVMLERSVQSKEINEKLDKGISLFLARISPYFLLKPAQKCLEWLIHRFHIQLYNVDSLLACTLPYHETKIFSRVVQLLKISEPTHRWHWLHALQRSGVPLARGTLITHCYKDLSFMDFICTMVTKAVEAYSTHSTTHSQLRVVFAFYASTMVSTLDAVDKVTDTIISKLLPFVQKGLKSSVTDYKAATYMIVCQLAVKVVMEGSLVNTLALHVAKSMVKEPVLTKEGLGCLIVLIQNQKKDSVGPKAFGHLCCVSSVVESLQAMALVHDISPLLHYLLPLLVHAVVTERYDEMEQDAEVPAHGLLLESVVRSLPLTNGLDNTVARLLLVEYLGLGAPTEEHIAALNQRLLPLVRLFESKYCGALDDALSGHVCDFAAAEQKQLFHHFISLTMSSGKFQILGDSDTSLLLSLKHPLSSVRNLAVEHLAGLLSSGQQENLDQSFLREALLDRMQDHVPEVVAAALKALELYIDRLEPEDTISCLLSLLERTDVSLAGQWLPVLQDCVRVLSDPRLGRGNAELSERLAWRLLPFLVLTGAKPDSPQLQLATCVATCPILAQQPLTQSWAKELSDVVSNTSTKDLLAKANARLVSSLSSNLALMDPFSKRSALEKLAMVVEQLQGTGLRARTAFLVLTQTLLQGLGQQSDTHHLVTAQRIYTCLERHLLEASGDGKVSTKGCQTSFSGSLTVYLEKARGGSAAEAEYLHVLLSLLRGFISALKCPDPSFRGDVWWNPEKLDTSTCCYLHLLCRLFDVTISGSSQGPAERPYRDLMKLLFQVHLSTPMDLMKFLCMLWDYGANQGDQLDVRVGAVLQTQALYVGQAVLTALPASTLPALASNRSPVVPSLLACLCSPLREVRRAAVAVLDQLSEATESSFQPLITRLLKNTEEIIADPSHLSQALSVLHEEVSADAEPADPQKPTLGTAFQQLLQTIKTSACPSYTAVALLRALDHVNGESVLMALMPVLDLLVVQSGQDPTFLRNEAQLSQLVLGKYNEEAAPLLAKDQACLALFVQALKSPLQPYPDIPSIQVMALEQITKAFFAALGEEKVQQQLLGVMFDLLADSREALVSSAISSVFKGLAVDAELVAKELVPPEKPKVSVTVQQTRRSKMLQRKAEESGESKPEEEAVLWQRVTLILELLQHKKKLKRPQALVPALFTLLSRSLQPGPGIQANVEYTRQLLLSCLLNVCQKLSPDGEPVATDILEEDKFNVELVVQCVRVSDMPQTHHHALLLLGTVASMFPEKVLHNIMPIFTFMGANIMRLDDSYSFQVINKTVQTVIPALIKAHEGSETSNMDVVVIKIVHVFVDALPHVPEHRRLPILSQLVTTLGPARFLWVLMLLLFKQHATKTAGSAADKEVALEMDVEFWTSLCCTFEVSEQLTSVIHILQYLMGLPQDKEDAVPATTRTPAPRRGARRKEPQPQEEEKAEELLFNVEAHSSKELRHFKFLSVNFTAQLLAASGFIGKLADTTDAGEDDGLLQLQQSLLEETLRYIHSVARCVEENSDKPTAKFWRALLNKAYDVLDKVNSLLPTDTFIMVMKGLMTNRLPSVRRKAMELLNNKLQHKTKWEEQQVTVLLRLSDDLLAIVGRGHGQGAEQPEAEMREEQEEELAINRQTALYSLKLLCRNFGAAHPEAFVPVLQRAVEVATATEEEKNVTGSALLCIAEVASVLKTLAIPQLPRLMPAVLQTMEERKDLLSNEIYLLSAVTALQRVSETLPHFISPYLHATVSQVCRISRLAETSATSPQLSARLTSLSSTLATKVPPRVLLPTLTKCYNDMVPAKQSHLGPLMSILKAHITHMEKDQLNTHQSELTSFFLTALDFRAQHCQGDLPKTAEVEGFTIDCLLAMVMKLSEITFRPLFFKLFDWSKTETEGKQRLLTFYRLADRIADRLKGLFVLFAGNLVKPFSDLLQQTNVAKTDEALFDSADGVEKSTMLLHHVLDCMFKIFMYDTHHFLSKDRAEALMGPLVDQLENTLGGEESYQLRVTQHLVPCLGQFSVAMGDDTQWKTLNYQVLLKTRHSSSKVRFSALLMVMELARKLRENYMVLLPETIPFLAELMEDESEEVEHQVQKVIQEMENILGEPLQSYF
ncbi:HEAT repeat-containing protein 1 isoform X1 [Gadus morhua]|uniref:HEAT repeat-containing protein 1 n=1 Tax=Gadus morhua TaxID=8049 RepID=A0A8C5CBI7_GADMO|nr:HEAT repeat-containing protein 1 isoform X1 [Gadus morhua]